MQPWWAQQAFKNMKKSYWSLSFVWWCACKHLCAGKTRTSVTLAKHYGAACLSVNEVVQEALSSGSSPAAWRARELCAKAAVVFAQREEQEATVDITATSSSQAAGVLSMEAVAKHTAEGSQISDLKVPPSSASTRNKTNITGRSQKNDSSNPTASVVNTLINLAHTIHTVIEEKTLFS